MKRYKTLKQIHDDLEKGIEIFWSNTRYKVHYVDFEPNLNQYSLKNNKVIRVSCIDNYFGSLISESEISACFKLTK